MAILVGTPGGSAIALESLDVSNLFPGARITGLSTTSTFILTESAAALVTDEIVAVADNDNLRWVLETASGGALAAAGVWPLATGAYLVDGDQEVTPGTSKKSQYTLPAGTLTADGSVTLALTDVTNAVICDVNVEVQAHAFVVKNSVGGTLMSVPAGDARKINAYFQVNQWILSVWSWI